MTGYVGKENYMYVGLAMCNAQVSPAEWNRHCTKFPIKWRSSALHLKGYGLQRYQNWSQMSPRSFVNKVQFTITKKT